jgi:hypothetical protein
MNEENLSILRSLKQNIEKIVAPLEAAQLEAYVENEELVQNGLDLITGELTMIVMLLTNVDHDISNSELELLNDMRHVVYGYGIPELTSNDFKELCEKFLRLYPKSRFTFDHLPPSIRFLRAYDKTHGTDHAATARAIFIQFSDAIVKADKNEGQLETMVLENFKDVLNST